MSLLPSDDLIAWLKLLDANYLTPKENEFVAGFDLDDDAQLARLIKEWFAPYYKNACPEEQDFLRQVLDQWRQWPLRDVQRQFDMTIGDPVDIPRFMAALAKAVEP